MKINKITPQGYCGGVKNALNMVERAISDNSFPKPIYLLGAIIHNHHVISQLQEKGVLLLEDKSKSKLELIKTISSGTIVFSAHGCAPNVYQLARDKGLTILDTTCKNVLVIHNKIKFYLSEGYTCIYIGTKHHPECEGVLGISSSIILVSSLEDVKKLNIKNKKVYATNQTTLSIYDTDLIYSEIQKQYPNIIIDNKICNATTIRQKALLKQEKVDLCIVVGDSNSSNTKKLVLASQKAGICTTLVDNIEDVKQLNLSNISSISITSGASTPNYIVDEIIEYLKRAN
ncbi:MAG: 4-hydroxy-3-methylbut-2-enyl diphosphate reductase [Anaeroplasmataceae bacterium]|nr:4-hydroxy-3-methylbut-2-enyl diphosphate reductase [Anaeroplasmataceae bacterium]